MYFDLTYVILVLPAVIFSMWASANVKSTFNKYSNQFNSRGLTGAQAARRILDAKGLRYVPIQRTAGELTDHYDPKENVIRLSENVYNSSSTAAVGVACHEAGHAMQYADNYAPVKIRTAIVPLTNFGSKLSMPLVIAGLLLSSFAAEFIQLAYLGVFCFGICTVFQLITLPTEFNASRRALNTLEDNGILAGEELRGASKVLRAAALTYVAALAVSLMQLLRLMIMVSGNRRRR